MKLTITFLIFILSSFGDMVDEQKDGYLFEKEILTNDEVVNRINLGTKVIISEIEVIIATRKHNAYFEETEYRTTK